MDEKTYDDCWNDLNARLKVIEAEAGLAGVFAALETDQRAGGFILQNLDDVERLTFFDNGEDSDFFRIQFNPQRAQRFKGAGLSVPPDGEEEINGGCFLCRENIRWQQQGREIGYEIPIDDRIYYALANPFPLLPNHMTVASREHRPQDWQFAEPLGTEVDLIVRDLLAIASRAVGFVGFYNGANAGASNPDHFHFQFCSRPPEAPEFPLEKMVGRKCNGGDEEIMTEHYPLPVAVWKGTAEAVETRAAKWIRNWANRNGPRLQTLTGNFVVSNDGGPDRLTLYFVPRDRTKVHVNGFSGLIGSLEILGELVLSTEKDKRYLDNDRIDFGSIERSLARVQTPFYTD